MSNQLLIGILPLIVFAILDSFSGLKTAILGALAIILLEAAYSIYLFGELDWITFANLVLLAIYAGISWRNQSSAGIRMQPAVFSAVFATALIVSYLLDKSLLTHYMIKYKDVLLGMTEGLQRDQMLSFYQMPSLTRLLDLCTLVTGIGLILHSIICFIAAKKWNNFFWVLAKLSGYLIMFVSIFIAAILQNF
ncbi:MAG: hypothetical protein AB8E15_07305 [Bdellovibrionales bacterium]